MGIKKPQISQESCVRVGWKEAVEEALVEHGHEWQDDEWLNLPLVADEAFEW